MNIHSIYEKHHYRFLWFSLAFIIIFSSQYSPFWFNETKSRYFFNNPNDFLSLVCLFLILTVGISHGALDNLKGYKLLKYYKINNKIIFYLIYSAFAILVACVWFFFPSFVLIIFLIFAAHHFGKEDCSFVTLRKSKINFLKFFLKGSFIILLPLAFKFNQTLNIFKSLYIENDTLINTLVLFDKNGIFIYLVVISFLSNFFLSKNPGKYMTFFMEAFVLFLLNLATAPLVAFTIYFCFLHSVRHSITLAHEINKNDFSKGFKKFISKALPLTLITAIFFIISLLVLKNYYILNDSILKVIFIGLASLTFPHILLEYLLEKNEKRA
jgi:Brp/Blh family beta-carotene 15,15'-monooxygenase